MMTYVTAFIFYTLAMVGILLVGFVVYKKTMLNPKGENKGMIKVLDSLMIAPKKTLLVVKIKNEKFLIASGAEHTTFLAKLSDNEISKKQSAQLSQPLINSSNKEKEEVDELDTIPFFSKKEVNFNEIQNAKSAQIQKQFRELYEREDEIDEIPQRKIQNLSKKELLKQLLNNLNVEDSKIGSKF